MARILVLSNFHPNEGGVLAARKIGQKLRGLGHEVIVEKFPFVGSHLHAAIQSPHPSSPMDLRNHGLDRVQEAGDRNAVDAILDVHTTDARCYARPRSRQREWRHEWIDYDVPFIANRKGKYKFEVQGQRTAKRIKAKGRVYPARYVLELPAKTRSFPKHWQAKLRGVNVYEKAYLRLHEPVRLTERTAEKIAQGFHDFLMRKEHLD